MLTLFFMAVAGLVSFVTRYDPAEHADEYEFLAQDFRGNPIRWNPCEPIHYVVNLGLAPEGSMQDVHEAVRRMSVATGIDFDYDGLSNESPMRRRPVYQPERYGDRWAPVLIAWVDPDSSDISFAHDGSHGGRSRGTLDRVRRRRRAGERLDRDQSGRPEPARGSSWSARRAPSCCTSSATSWVSITRENFGQLMESSGGGDHRPRPGRPGGARTPRPAGRLPHHAADTPG